MTHEYGEVAGFGVVFYPLLMGRGFLFIGDDNRWKRSISRWIV